MNFRSLGGLPASSVHWNMKIWGGEWNEDKGTNLTLGIFDLYPTLKTAVVRQRTRETREVRTQMLKDGKGCQASRI